MRKVLKIAFLDGLDESYYEEAYEKMLYYGRLLHESMGRGWFNTRVDGGYLREAMDRLSREVELWVCHTVSFDPEIAAYYRTKGVDTWFYGPMIYEQRSNSVAELEFVPRPRPAGESRHRMDWMEVSDRLGGVGVRLERVCILV